MNELFEMAKVWFLGLGEQYGVNPIVFGSIYIGAIPFFTISIAWLIRNYRRNESIILPALSAVGFFISAYVYLIIVGQNVPWWVYCIVVLMVMYGAWSTLKNVRRKMNKVDKEIIANE